MKGTIPNYLYTHVSYNALASSEYLEDYLEGRATKIPVTLKQLANTLEGCVTISHETKQVIKLDDLSKEILRECLASYTRKKLDDVELAKQIYNVSLDLRDFKGFRNPEIKQLIKFCKDLGEKSLHYYSYRK